MNRQRVRKALGLLMLLLFPLIYYYLSPYLIIDAAGQGIVAGSFVVFALMLLTAVFFGRLYCGWLCPAGGLQEACFGINSKAAGGKADRLKYVVWVVWIGGIVFAAAAAGGLREVDFFYATTGGISIGEPAGFIMYYIVVAVIAGTAVIFGRRAFCRYLCWMAPFMVLGVKLQRLLGLPALHLEAEARNCVQCGACSRRCSMGLDVMAMVRENKLTHPECILCGECVDACPQRAVRYAYRKKVSRPQNVTLGQ